MSDKDLCNLSLFSLIIVFYSIEADSWINTKVLSPGGGFTKDLAVEAFTVFLLLMDLAILGFLIFQHKPIFNRTSVVKFDMPHLKKLW